MSELLALSLRLSPGLVQLSLHHNLLLQCLHHTQRYSNVSVNFSLHSPLTHEQDPKILENKSTWGSDSLPTSSEQSPSPLPQPEAGRTVALDLELLILFPITS